LRWRPGPGKVSQKVAKYALIMTSLPENSKSKTKNIFFKISTRRLAESVDALNSSLAESIGELWSWKKLKSRSKKWFVQDLTR